MSQKTLNINNDLKTKKNPYGSKEIIRDNLKFINNINKICNLYKFMMRKILFKTQDFKIKK